MAKSAPRKHSIVAKAKCAAQPVKKSKRTAAAASSSCWHHDEGESENSWKKFAASAAGKGYRPRDAPRKHSINADARCAAQPEENPKRTAAATSSSRWNDWSHATTNSKCWKSSGAVQHSKRNAKQRWTTSEPVCPILAVAEGCSADDAQEMIQSNHHERAAELE